ncbi:hypothetical protein SDC9_122775 [bioreactor metagenome]|uniref:Uncharacterized protein n=1 Tax=bioreactor metagenome TaxID=1076179 RepID=A0A645CFV7_9ZZZZ
MGVGILAADDQSGMPVFGPEGRGELAHVMAQHVERDPGFGDVNILRAGGQPGDHRQIARIAPHDFNHIGALGGIGRILDFVDGVEDGVQRGVAAERVFTARQIVVDRRRNRDHRNVEFRIPTPSCDQAVEQLVAAPVAEQDQAVEPPLAEVGGDFGRVAAVRLIAAGAEPRTAEGVPELRLHPAAAVSLAADQSGGAAFDADDFAPGRQAEPDQDARGAVHAGRGPAGGDDADMERAVPLEHLLGGMGERMLNPDHALPLGSAHGRNLFEMAGGEFRRGGAGLRYRFGQFDRPDPVFAQGDQL